MFEPSENLVLVNFKLTQSVHVQYKFACVLIIRVIYVHNMVIVYKIL